MAVDRFLLSACVASVLVAAEMPLAQPAQTPAFEVASIKTTKSRTEAKGVRIQPGRLTIDGLTAREIVAFAYDIPNPLRISRIAGGPNWLDSDRFNIVAKAADSAATDRLRMMLRALLADRFHMIARTTTLDRPVYALSLARSDGSLGPRLHRSDIDCRQFWAARGGALPPLPRDPKDVSTCVIRAEPGLIVARARTMADLVTVAFPRVVEDRVVVDRTGLTGSYDVLLEWTPERKPFASAADLPPGLPVPAPPSTDGPSIFTAIQEQLGLKLQSARAPVEVLLIDHIERPAED
jgi:bla regulator protein blaR1